MAFRYLFIGLSAATIGAVTKLLQIIPGALITVITDQVELPYNKCWLADYLAQTKTEQELLIAQALLNKVVIIYQTKVIAINRRAKQVHCDNGDRYDYDFLFMGMGAHPFIPAIFGQAHDNLFTFNTLADAIAIKKHIEIHPTKNIIIVGAGLSGLECADALRGYNLSITLVEKNDQVLAGLLSASGAAFLQSKIMDDGLTLLLNTQITQWRSDNGNSIEVVNSDGRILICNMIIIATGLRANSQLAKDAGLSLGVQGGIQVNDYMQTADPFIFAGGDVIEIEDQLTHRKMRSCLWPGAMLQGMIAAQAMAGQPKKYPGSHIITSSAFFGLKFAQAGTLDTPERLIETKPKEFYHQFAFEGGYLKGFEVLGNHHNGGVLRRMILTNSVVKPEDLKVAP